MGIRVFPDAHNAAEGEREVDSGQESEARQALRDPHEVAAFLTKLVAFGRAQKAAANATQAAAPAAGAGAGDLAADANDAAAVSVATAEADAGGQARVGDVIIRARLPELLAVDMGS
jgi:hypothetical protein